MAMGPTDFIYMHGYVDKCSPVIVTTPFYFKLTFNMSNIDKACIFVDFLRNSLYLHLWLLLRCGMKKGSFWIGIPPLLLFISYLSLQENLLCHLSICLTSVFDSMASYYNGHSVPFMSTKGKTYKGKFLGLSKNIQMDIFISMSFCTKQNGQIESLCVWNSFPSLFPSGLLYFGLFWKNESETQGHFCTKCRQTVCIFRYNKIFCLVILLKHNYEPSLEVYFLCPLLVQIFSVVPIILHRELGLTPFTWVVSRCSKFTLSTGEWVSTFCLSYFITQIMPLRIPNHENTMQGRHWVMSFVEIPMNYLTIILLIVYSIYIE